MTEKKSGLGTLALLAIILGLLAWYFNHASGPVTANASVHPLVRIAQMAPAQYASRSEYTTWAASACSATAMTEVINVYVSHPHTIHDILTVESALHEITPELGLLDEEGIAQTVAHFGFQTTWGHERSLDQVVAIANAGHPVIVSIPPQRSSDFYNGHILVVTGGTSREVLVADSSQLNLHSFSRSNFLRLWGGFSAVVTPGQGGEQR